MRSSTLRGLWVTVVAMLALAAAMALPHAASALELTNFEAPILDSSANEETQAGQHPHVIQNTIEIDYDLTPTPTQPFGTPSGAIKDVIVEMPPGVLGNPNLLPQCEVAQFTLNECPPDSQVGTLRLSALLPPGGGFDDPTPVFNLVPPPGAPAQFAGSVLGWVNVFITASVRPDDYGITMTIRDTSTTLPLIGTDLALWGDPASSVWNNERGYIMVGNQMCDMTGRPGPCFSGLAPTPFLTTPTTCEDPAPVTRVRMNSWEHPNTWDTMEYTHPAFDGCESLDYRGKFKVTPESRRAGAPSGYTIELDQQLSESAKSLATSQLKDAELILPEGVRINPATAIGLEGCTPEQVGLGSDDPVRCPQASRIGSVEIKTPMLKDVMRGAIYQAAPHNNPFNSLLALYLVPENRAEGVTMKLAGQVAVDEKTGQIKATFPNNPQQPFSKLTLNFKGGDRAVLVNPRECGTHTAQGSLTPWSGNDPLPAPASFLIDQGCEQVKKFEPRLHAGSSNPVAGDTTAFTLAFQRDDDDREIKEINSIRLPEGLLAYVGRVPLCEETQAATGTCPEASRVGRVNVGLGAGTPLWVPEAGKDPTGVYLTGPYKGAPYGLSIKVPAQAGPFNLGTVVVRSALHVDQRTTQITTGIDETRLIDRNGTVTEVLPDALPRILDGIMLNQREIRVIMDRDGFMVNPTNCSPQQITAELGSFEGDQVAVSNRFRAVECASLGFAPRFNVRIMDKGRRSTLRSWHPQTRFAVSARRGDANLRTARVVLPSSMILDQANLDGFCRWDDLQADNCPRNSIVGQARAWSPLLNRVIQGPVYLAANLGARPLPDLVAVMDGEIRVRLLGEIRTIRRGRIGRLQTTFRTIPDAPITRFVLTMLGGKNRGLLVNSTDLCRTNERGVVAFRGQNGRAQRLRPRIATTFRGCAKVRRQVARRANARKAAAARAAGSRATSTGKRS